MRRAISLTTITLLILLTGCTTGFDSSEWKAHNDMTEVDNPRYNMTEELKSKVLKTGMTESEVTDLLGDPGKREENSDGTVTLTYPIGWNTTITQEPIYFIVTIGGDGKYSSSEVKGD